MLEYLLQEYERTKFKYFLLTRLQHIGVFEKKEAYQLYESGKIKVRKGFNGTIIELIIEDNDNK